MNRRIAGVTAMLLLCGAIPRAWAGEDEDIRELLDEPVVTTASKSAEPGANAPATSTTLTADDMRTFGIHSIDEAIQFLSLGVMTSNPLHAVDIGARGILLPNDQGSHFLLLVDGHAVNEPLYGTARFERGAGIPIELVDHIEVILGPGSVLYGSNAMLGVINVITKKAKDFKGARVVAETEVAKSYRLAGGFGYRFDLFGTPSELTVMMEGYHQKGPTFTFGPQNVGLDAGSGQPVRFSKDAPGTGIWGGRATDSYYATVPAIQARFVRGGLEISFHASSYERATPYFNAFTRYEANFNEPLQHERDRSMWIDAKYTAILSPIVSLTTRLYGDTFDYLRQGIDSRAGGCLYVGTTTCDNQHRGASRWAGLELQTSFDWLKDASVVSLLGIDVRTVFAGHKLDQRDFDTGRYLRDSDSVIDAHDQTLGAYVQTAWRPSKLFELNAGARLDAGRVYRPVASPRAAITVHPWKGGALKLVYAEAFRAPSWYERASYSANEVIARDLQPERVRSVEASIEQRIGAQRLFFGIFRSEWTNLIEQHVLTRSEINAAAARGEIDALRALVFAQYRNVSEIENLGINAAFEGSLFEGKLRFGTNVTSAIARRSEPEGGTSSHALPVAPQLFGNARVAYALPEGWPTLALAASYLGRRPADRAYDGSFVPSPYAPALVELRATVAGPFPGVSGLLYRTSFDWALASRAPYVVGPTQSIDRANGINSAELAPIDRYRVTVGLEWRFLEGGP
jgi:outer membrane receptor for ferrienterochelin and colicins